MPPNAIPDTLNRHQLLQATQDDPDQLMPFVTAYLKLAFHSIFDFRIAHTISSGVDLLKGETKGNIPYLEKCALIRDPTPIDRFGAKRSGVSVQVLH
jgi:hypothetical protein